jgi:hypothetical protein
MPWRHYKQTTYLYYISLTWSLSCAVLCCPALFTICGQTAGPIGPKIGTNTHWDYGTHGATYLSKRLSKRETHISVSYRITLSEVFWDSSRPTHTVRFWPRVAVCSASYPPCVPTLTNLVGICVSRRKECHMSPHPDS